MSSVAVAAVGVERRYGRHLAVRGITLDVPEGACVAIFGPNGAGKTTFLRILAQVLRPSAGQVRVFGREIRDDPIEVRRCIGFVGHELGLYLDLTATESLTFSARLYGLDRIPDRIERMMSAVGMGDRATQPVRAMSRGLQQRLALARALLHEPRLLLLDEPWTGLDPIAQQILKQRLESHRANGGTAILATHDIALGLASADRIVLLRDGRIELETARDEVNREELEAVFEAPPTGGST